MMAIIPSYLPLTQPTCIPQSPVSVRPISTPPTLNTNSIPISTPSILLKVRTGPDQPHTSTKPDEIEPKNRSLRDFYQNRPWVAYPITGGLLAGLAAATGGISAKIRKSRIQLQMAEKKQPLSEFGIYAFNHYEDKFWKPGQTDDTFLRHIRALMKQNPDLETKLGKSDNIRFLAKHEYRSRSKLDKHDDIGVERLTDDDAFIREVLSRFEDVFHVQFERPLFLTLGSSLNNGKGLFASAQDILKFFEAREKNNAPQTSRESRGFLIHGANGDSILVTKREVIDTYLLKWRTEVKEIAASKRDAAIGDLFGALLGLAIRIGIAAAFVYVIVALYHRSHRDDATDEVETNQANTTTQNASNLKIEA